MIRKSKSRKFQSKLRVSSRHKNSRRKPKKNKSYKKPRKSIKKNKSYKKPRKSIKKKKTAAYFGFNKRSRGVGNGVDDRARVKDWLTNVKIFRDACKNLYTGFNLEKVKEDSLRNKSNENSVKKHTLKKEAEIALQNYNNIYVIETHTEPTNYKRLLEAAFYYMFKIVLYLEYRNSNVKIGQDEKVNKLAKNAASKMIEEPYNKDQILDITNPITSLWPIPPQDIDYTNIFLN